MYKYILTLSIISVSSVLTGLNITPEITSNLINIEQLQSEKQSTLELIAQSSNNNENDSLMAGEERDARVQYSTYAPKQV
ncbi:MAG: hypothetical protein MGF17_03230 [Trichodesmium sp. MAG_R04]|nr:hypothetical protein [Trichodesmium sp. MAG_R04]